VKIFVVGSCQALPLARCLSLMNPAFQVERFPLFSDLSDIAGDDDVVFRQRDSRTLTHESQRPNEFLYPRIWFKAFHPDAAPVFAQWGPVLPPLGEETSSLAVYGWKRGFSVAQTMRLFAEPVYERLGFFDCWHAAKQALLDEGNVVGMPFDAVFARLERSGCFMRTPAHPALIVLAEIARALVRRAGLATTLDNPEDYLDDPFLRYSVWPVYPEIAERLGLPGSYVFKPFEPTAPIPPLFDLEQFITRSFAAFALVSPDDLLCGRIVEPAFHDLESVIAGERKRGSNGAVSAAPQPVLRAPDASPYANLPDSQFWRRAVGRVRVHDVDPVGAPPFRIGRGDRIATVGSCFAQHMSRALALRGYNYFVAEPAPPELPAESARPAGYGVFSTRCGNVYTPRQLLQLFDRAYGTFAPCDEAWQRADDRYADPFRPEIEPGGFESVAQLLASRELHLAAVRTMFEQLDVLVFTLGLTEAWRSSVDGAVFPLAPGVSAGRMDLARYEFVNFTVAELRDDLNAFLARLRKVNPAARVILTVSPQPPIATYEPRHVLVSSAYTKAALRVAVDEVQRANPEVWYFPGYEIVTGAHAGGVYFESDLRTVTPGGVAHVMRLFLAHCAADNDPPPSQRDALVLQEHHAQLDVVCDEELMEADRKTILKLVEGIAASSGESQHNLMRSWVDQIKELSSRWSDFDCFREFSGFFVVPGLQGVALDPVAMEVLDRASMRARVEAELPRTLPAGVSVTLACTVTNCGDVALTSGGQYPVFVCYRWYDAAGELAEVGRSIHTALPAALGPGASVEVAMRLASPRNAGTYRLGVTLLQSEVAWFDDVDPANGLQTVVDVAPHAGVPLQSVALEPA
jgi:hypothetical protein